MEKNLETEIDRREKSELGRFIWGDLLVYSQCLEGRSSGAVSIRIPIHFVECKLSETDDSLALRYLKKRFSQVAATQVVLEGDMDVMTKDNIRVCSAHHFLKDFAKRKPAKRRAFFL